MGKERKNIELLEGETLLLEAEGWAVIHDSGNDHRTQRVYGSHAECTVSWGEGKQLADGKYFYGEYCWLAGHPPTCGYCDAPVPDGIQAVIHLRTWGQHE